MRRIGIIMGRLVLACTLGASAQAAPLPPDTDHEAFDTAVRGAVTPEVAQSLASLKVLHLSADHGRWLDAGLVTQAGQPVTWLLSGRVYWSRALALWLPPQLALWGQLGEGGTIFNGARPTHTFVADRAAPLRLRLYPDGAWTSPNGQSVGEPAPVNPDAGGGVSVALLAWKPGTDVAAQMSALARNARLAPWAAAESARLAEGEHRPPAGWNDLWELGRNDIFRRVPEGRGSAIELATHGDVGILQKDAAIALRPGTRLSWAWRLDRLPSPQPEASIPTHDYLSIAVEFDDGRDLTFLWSQGLPVGQVFACPLPAWKDRETHVVQRSGAAGLGEWHDESVDLYAAVRRAYGDHLPQRVVRVWIIANSLFQRGAGRGRFARIALEGNGERVAVE